MNRKLSPLHFSLSMLVIFLVSLVYITALYFLLNPKPVENYLTSGFPVTTKPVSLTLNLTNPDDNLLVFDSDLLIQGKTSPNSSVVISLDDQDLVSQISKDGDFSTTVKLQSGVNYIMVAVFDGEENSKTESRTVYYSTEKL
ncbi:MAG: hypothetical protein V1808_01635 [Candidatus Daviesbacteria bacterium]